MILAFAADWHGDIFPAAAALVLDNSPSFVAKHTGSELLDTFSRGALPGNRVHFSTWSSWSPDRQASFRATSFADIGRVGFRQCPFSAEECLDPVLFFTLCALVRPSSAGRAGEVSRVSRAFSIVMDTGRSGIFKATRRVCRCPWKPSFAIKIAAPSLANRKLLCCPFFSQPAHSSGNVFEVCVASVVPRCFERSLHR